MFGNFKEDKTAYVRAIFTLIALLLPGAPTRPARTEKSCCFKPRPTYMPYEKCVLLTDTVNPSETYKLALTSRNVAIKRSRYSQVRC